MNCWAQLWDSFAKVLPMSTFILLGVSESGVYQNWNFKEGIIGEWLTRRFTDCTTTRCSAEPHLRILRLDSKSHIVWILKSWTSSDINDLGNEAKSAGRAKVYFNAAGRLLATSRQTLLHCDQTGIAVGNALGVPASKLGHTAEPSVDPSLLTHTSLLMSVHLDTRSSWWHQISSSLHPYVTHLGQHARDESWCIRRLKLGIKHKPNMSDTDIEKTDDEHMCYITITIAIYNYINCISPYIIIYIYYILCI